MGDRPVDLPSRSKQVSPDRFSDYKNKDIRVQT
jgi:hypothetical protein